MTTEERERTKERIQSLRSVVYKLTIAGCIVLKAKPGPAARARTRCAGYLDEIAKMLGCQDYTDDLNDIPPLVTR